MQIIKKNFSLKEKPSINLEVCRVEASVWRTLGFSKFHYMSSELNKSCKCLLFTWNNIPVAFVGIINQPGRHNSWGYRVSRMVIMPDFQGLGLARKILDFCGGIIKASNPKAELYMKTIHDNMGKMLERNNKWIPTAYNNKERIDKQYEGKRYTNRLSRKSYCYKYNGDTIYGYEDLLLPIKVLRERKTNPH